ncbi:hypothetical protein BCY89_05830 [Sphingobacterium siyangense]|uniref:Uncharacterized protein n=1 Tax=Sphingobacterium siyangense TaxID=459529 RepID=A0A420FW46_9SPHI|nr:hypothetical protein [Sphingobacterium siyangense]RKF37170.1 hypothetical protein BCY89_05830 [Sphingobacterium siyangense]
MNYANTISRNGKASKKRKPSATAQTVGAVRTVDEKTKGCRGNTKGQTEVRTACDVANAFLEMRFPPRLQETETIQDCDRLKMDRDFKKSLSLIAKKFNLSLQDSGNIPFPYNIAESMADLKKQLKKAQTDWKEVRLVHHNNSTYFAKEDRYDTGMTLYYIPVIPLYNILHNSETEQASQLLLSVYAYIYQVLGVPYYRTDDCYLYSMYEMLENWMYDDGAEEEFIADFNDAKRIGDFIKKIIIDTINLHSYTNRLKTFVAKTDFDKKCLTVAKSFYKIFCAYPNVQIDRKFYPLRFRERIDIDERAVSLDNYVSFCASIHGSLFESLGQSVNDDLQEYCEIDEPTRFIPYDNRRIKENNFDFENKVFNAIDSLIQIWQEHQY